MRYIKTKDGEIYDTIEDEKIRLGRNDKTHEIIFLLLPNTNTFNMPIRLNVIDQADTIEELCDCFVCVGKKHIFWDKELTKGVTLEGIKLSYDTTNFEIYGAIWTGRGLIYVAKQNEKGELELL